MSDNYSHQDHTVIYITENVPGPSENSTDFIKLLEDYNSQLTNKCNCDYICKAPQCCCLEQSGGSNYVFTSSEKSKSYLNQNKMNNDVITPILECNDLCSCAESCGNRLVQIGPLASLYVGISSNENKGLGLFCSNNISKGTFVCEYAGEVITKSQAIFRQQSNSFYKDMNYIFCLNEHTKNGTTQTFIDPSKFGNIGRYANHSCEPNCVIVPVRVNIPIPKLALFACANIPPHTEITFHYGSSSSSDLMSNDFHRKKCLCGSSKCKGWMPYQMF